MAVERVGDVGQSRLTGQGFGSEAEADLPPRPGRPVELGRRRVSDQLEQRDAALSCWEESEVRTRAFKGNTKSSQSAEEDGPDQQNLSGLVDLQIFTLKTPENLWR